MVLTLRPCIGELSVGRPLLTGHPGMYLSRGVRQGGFWKAPMRFLELLPTAEVACRGGLVGRPFPGSPTNALHSSTKDM